MPFLFRVPFFFAAFLCLVTSPSSRAAELDLVGREMVRMLQNGHYARLPFNEDLSSRFLERYLNGLDENRLYFLKSEVTGFQRRYGRRLHDLISTRQAMPVAAEIFERYQRRVAKRVKYSQILLEQTGSFTFTGNRRALADRTSAPWPVDGRALGQAWQEAVEMMILDEKVERRRLRDRARELGQPDPFREAKSVQEVVRRKFDRLGRTVQGMTEEDMANFFFSAIAKAYDPHSDYFSANEMAQFRIDVSNELVGIGARLQMNDDGETEVKGLVNDGPADRQGGLKLGDRIIAISAANDGNWVEIIFQPIHKVIEYVLGREGAPVGIRFRREIEGQDQVFEISIPRGVVTMKDELAWARVYAYQGVRGIARLAVLTIPSFYFDFEDQGSRVSHHVEQLLERLRAERIDGLILDLRDNPGGSLPEAQRLTGFFLGEGPVVQVRSANGQVLPLDSRQDLPLYDGPLVVMTNRGSASATEILAGALQDYHRAVVIGSSSTFGKGTVQRTQNIGDSMPIFSDRDRAGWLKLTFQKYYRVSGSSVQRRGVVPDLLLPSVDEVGFQDEKDRKYALPHDVIRASPGFRPRDPELLHRSQLKKNSAARVAANPYFAFVREDVERLREEENDPTVSLNLDERLAELTADEERRAARRRERTDRFARLLEEDRKNLTIYRLTLDDLKANHLPVAHHGDLASDYLRSVKDEKAALDPEVEWPNGMDAEKREALEVLLDLLEVSQGDDVARAAE